VKATGSEYPLLIEHDAPAERCVERASSAVSDNSASPTGLSPLSFIILVTASTRHGAWQVLRRGAF